MATWKVGAARNLPVLERGEWDGEAAKARIFAWAGWDDRPNSSRARRAFLIYDADAPDLKGSYKLPFADVDDGTLQAVTSGLRAAASRLPQTDAPQEVLDRARAVLDGYMSRIKNKEEVLQQLAATELWSEPETSAVLRVVGADGAPADLTSERRRELRDQLAEGTLDELLIEIMAFKARYPNANCLRFRDEDLEEFARSFKGQPFLRDHNDRQIEARGGTIRESRLEGQAFVQRVALTVPRDIEAFLNGQIDRFSISWFWKQPMCSVCGNEWLSPNCGHQPGRKYANESGKREKLCELVFVEPRGKETSAVNAPAVAGTGVRGVLADLLALAPDLDAPEAGLSEPTEDDMDEEQKGAVSESVASVPDMTEAAALLREQKTAVLDAKLAGCGLPPALQEAVRGILPEDWKVAQLDAAIGTQRAAWAKLEADHVVQNVGAPRDAKISGMITGLDQITEALEALLDGRRPKSARPLSGIREAYLLLSGDYEMTGMFHPERVGLASVTSTTMANITADLLNKRVVNAFQQYPRWWEQLSRQEDFATLQTVQWITLGGIGALPTVAEGAAYTELTWDDSKETSAWVKKGGYLGITLEAMDKDDVGRLRSAPQALAQAAYLTLGRSVSAIFTASTGVGPTMEDTGALFNATAVSSTGGHANLLTAALSTSAWQAVKLAMRKQTEVNSAERLGGLVVPKFLLVPPDLEPTALTVLASENLPGGANNDVNPETEGSTLDARMAAARRRIVVVDFWTDTNNWAAVADPLLYPTIGIGYRYGRVPEIFSVASDNAGLMFTNDTMPIKVRWFYACGPMDWRGLHKNNVA